MVSWILVIIALFIIAILYIKFEHAGKRFKWLLIILFFVFIFISGSVILSQANIKLNSFDGVLKATTLYFSWLANTATNLWNSGSDIAKIVGNAIKTNVTSTR